MKVLAFAVSMLFHPLLLPLYVLFITFNTGTVHAKYVLFVDPAGGDVNSIALLAVVEVVGVN